MNINNQPEKQKEFPTTGSEHEGNSNPLSIIEQQQQNNQQQVHSDYITKKGEEFINLSEK